MVSVHSRLNGARTFGMETTPTEFAPRLDRLVTHPALDKAHVTVLEALEFLGPSSTKDIATLLNKSLSATNRSIAQLASAGLVDSEQTGCTGGGRNVVYAVIDPGLLTAERQIIEAARASGVAPGVILMEAISSYVTSQPTADTLELAAA